ncbi:MAG: hypothetical protein D4R40_02260 [Nitrosomonadaceae bacterium]|nr:MAG: hypothetical protein D4R40_02260 [Nitrosomonadaceae bacterium]
MLAPKRSRCAGLAHQSQQHRLIESLVLTMTYKGQKTLLVSPPPQGFRINLIVTVHPLMKKTK